MTNKKALEKIESIVGSWEVGNKTSTDAINAVSNIIRELKEKK